MVKNTSWVTGVSTMVTNRNCSFNFKLDEFSMKRTVNYTFHVDETKMSLESLRYDMITGLDLMNKLGLIISYEEKILERKDLKTRIIISSTKFKSRII